MRSFRLACLAASLLLGAAGLACAQSAAGFRPDGSVNLGSASVPYSHFASPESRAFFPKMLTKVTRHRRSRPRSSRAARSTTA